MFVYCKGGAGGKLVNEEDGVALAIIQFMAIADIWLVAKEETFFCLRYY